MKIAIDARIINTSTGRYVERLLSICRKSIVKMSMSFCSCERFRPLAAKIT